MSPFKGDERMKDRINHRPGTKAQESAQLVMLYFSYVVAGGLILYGLSNMGNNMVVGGGEVASGLLVGGASIYFDKRITRRARERGNSTPTKRR